MITINWGTKVINVPQADLTHVSGTLYELNVDTFRLRLKDLEDDADGMPFLRTHNHNPEVTVAGTVIARVVEIINGYTVTFQDGQYAVKLVGANNNIADVTNVNQVSVRSTNSTGLVNADLWTKAIEGSVTAEQILRVLAAVAAGKTTITPGGGGAATVKFRDLADTKDRVVATMDGSERDAVSTNLS